MTEPAGSRTVCWFDLPDVDRPPAARGTARSVGAASGRAPVTSLLGIGFGSGFGFGGGQGWTDGITHRGGPHRP